MLKLNILDNSKQLLNQPVLDRQGTKQEGDITEFSFRLQNMDTVRKQLNRWMHTASVLCY